MLNSKLTKIIMFVRPNIKYQQLLLKKQLSTYYSFNYQKTIQDSVDYIANADVLIIGGTSLAVYPAAGLIDYYRGNKLVLVNKTPTPRDGQADLIVKGNIGEIFSAL